MHASEGRSSSAPRPPAKLTFLSMKLTFLSITLTFLSIKLALLSGQPAHTLLSTFFLYYFLCTIFSVLFSLYYFLCAIFCTILFSVLFSLYDLLYDFCTIFSVLFSQFISGTSTSVHSVYSEFCAQTLQMVRR